MPASIRQTETPTTLTCPRTLNPKPWTLHPHYNPKAQLLNAQGPRGRARHAGLVPLGNGGGGGRLRGGRGRNMGLIKIPP